MKIGELAEISGTTTRTIRYYEELGLLKPSKHSRGGFRLYSKKELEKLYLINHLKTLNFSLTKIKRILEIGANSKTGKDMASNMILVLKEQHEEATEKIAGYMELQNLINKSNNILSKCMDCKHKPGLKICETCGLLGDIDKLPLPVKILF